MNEKLKMTDNNSEVIKNEKEVPVDPVCRTDHFCDRSVLRLSIQR